MLAIYLFNIIVAVLLIILAIPLYYKKISMNGWYGVKLKKSFTSDELWYRINQQWAVRAIGVSVFHLASSSLIYAFCSGISSPVLELLFALFPVIMLVIHLYNALSITRKI